MNLATIVTTFQRFESQKIVGRNYPWCSFHQAQARVRKLQRCTYIPDELKRELGAGKGKRVQKTPSTHEYPDVLKNFNIRYSEENANRDSNNLGSAIGSIGTKSLNVGEFNFDSRNSNKIINDPFLKLNYTDDDKFNEQSTSLIRPDTVDNNNPDPSVLIERSPSSKRSNVPDDDLMEHINEIKNYIHESGDAVDIPSVSSESPVTRGSSINYTYDRVPSMAPPPRPTSLFPSLQPLNRLSTWKDMLLFNAENMIKEHVPRLPAGAFEHHHHSADEKLSAESQKEKDERKHSTDDTTDFIMPMPTRKRMIQGIEQDDFIGKFVLFCGWTLFLFMRILALSLFALFYLAAALYLILAHYVVMLVCIFYEIKFHEKLERKLFYIFLGYVYIYSLIEFKIKFNNVRVWYTTYYIFVYTQNIVITLIWYNSSEFHSWWFYFMYVVIQTSGGLSFLCLLFYYFFLKPKDKILFANEDIVDDEKW